MDQARELRDLMVIDKARHSSYKISIKSWLIMMITWSLWLYALYHLGDKYVLLLSRPLVAGWSFLDVLQSVSIILLVQLNFLFVWSIIVQKRVRALHKS